VRYQEYCVPRQVDRIVKLLIRRFDCFFRDANCAENVKEVLFGSLTGGDGCCELASVVTLRGPVTGIERLRVPWRGWCGLSGAG
jgi:hypothetical protein